MAAAKKTPKDILSAVSPNALLVAGWVVGVVGVLAGYYFAFYEPDFALFTVLARQAWPRRAGLDPARRT